MAEEGPQDAEEGLRDAEEGLRDTEEEEEEAAWRPKSKGAGDVISQVTGNVDKSIYNVLLEGWAQIEHLLSEVDPALAEEAKTEKWYVNQINYAMQLEGVDAEFFKKVGIKDKDTISKLLQKTSQLRENAWYTSYAEQNKMLLSDFWMGWKDGGNALVRGTVQHTYAEKWGISKHDKALFGRDGIWVTSTTCDGMIFVWPADHLDPLPPCVRCIQPHFSICTGGVTDFGRMRAVTVGTDCKVVLTDLEAGTRLGACRTELRVEPENAFLCVDADFESDRCAVGTAGPKGGLVKVFDLGAEKQVASMKGAKDDIYSVKVDFDLNQVVAGSWDHNLYTYDIRSGQRTKTLRCHEMHVNDVQVDFEQRIAVSVADEDRMILWDLDVGGIIREYPIEHRAHALAVDFKLLRAATGGIDGKVRVWDLESAECMKEIETASVNLQALDVYWDMGLVLTGSWDYQMKLFDYHSGRCMKKFLKQRRCITQVAIKQTGGHVPMGHDGAPMWHMATPNPYETA